MEQDTLDDVPNQSTTETIVSIDYKVAFSFIESLKSLFNLKGIYSWTWNHIYKVAASINNSYVGVSQFEA